MPNSYPMFGDNPAQVRGGQSDYKRLFFTEPENALTLNKGLHAGFGVLEEGTILAKSVADGLLVPYPKTSWAAGISDPAYSLLLIDQVNGNNTCRVSLNEAYKYKVGDSIVLRNNPTTPVYADGGLITGIVYTADYATITFTTATAVATFTVANGACVYLKSKATSPFKAAYGILTGSVDTGYGPSSGVGAGGAVAVSNAILYVGGLVQYDTDALTDLGASVDGNLMIVK